MLEATDVVSGYGQNEVLHGVHVRARDGEITAIIGPNGSGKSTLLKTLVGAIRLWKGRIVLGGEEIAGLQPGNLLRKGVALVPQGRRVFPRMSVEENIEMGGYLLDGRTVADRLEKTYSEFPFLRDRRKQLAGTLSGGEQTLLCVARSLILEPKVLMLDEPSLGLAPKVMNDVFKKFISLNEAGVTMLIVEQNVKRALDIADYVYILDLGQNRFDGTSHDVLKNNELVNLYIG